MRNRFKQIYSLITQSIKVGFVHIFSGSVLVKCISFFTSILVSHALTKPEMALLSYSDNIYAYFNLALGLGVSGAIIRFCSSTILEKRFSYFKFGFTVGILFQCVLCFIIVILAKLIDFPFPNTEQVILLMILFPFIQFVYDYSLNFIRAEMRHKPYAILSALSTIILLISLFFLVDYFHIYGVITARYLSYVLTGVACLYMINTIRIEYKKKSIIDISLNKYEKRDFLKFAIINQTASACSSLISINEAFIVNNIIMNQVVTANYKIASIIPQNILFITSSVMIFIYPYFVRNSTNYQWLMKYTKIVIMLLVLFYGICLIIYIPCANKIIEILFGAQYISISNLSILLFAANCIEASIRIPMINIFSAMGEVKCNLYFTILSVILHFIIDYILINLIGIDGAVYGIFATYLVFAIVYWKKFKKIISKKIKENNDFK